MTNTLATEQTQPREPLSVLWLDEHIVAVDKPAGMLVHRAADEPDSDIVLQTLRDQIERHLYPVQRLDKLTSGVLVFALEKSVAPRLQAAMRKGTKHYTALVLGQLHRPCAFSAELTNRRGNLRPARTEATPLESGQAGAQHVTHCTLKLCTGRYQQIRRHLADASHAIAGDPYHGSAEANDELREAVGLERMFLHAATMEIAHPVTEETLRLEAPLPDSLQDVLRSLELTALT